MESTRPIRALARGLDALTVLNSRDGATVSEVAQEIRLPRTTVYRILETLCTGGFTFRDDADARYRLTLRVRGLSEGFVDEIWIERIAAPQIEAVCRDIAWPLFIATLSGQAMMVRKATDHHTPLAVERISAGCRLPLLTSAAGLAFLAFCPDPEREMLLDGVNGATREELLATLAPVVAQGFATTTRTRRTVEEISASVPVVLPDRILAVLTVRFEVPALPLRSGLERFIPRLRHCAAQIGTLYLDQQAAAA